MVKMIEKTTFRFTRFAVLALVVGFGAGCTKKEESAKLYIEMPNWNAVTEKYSAAKTGSQTARGKIGALSGTKVTAVTRVMINISGPGMNTVVRIWDFNDAPRTANSLPTPPSEFSFEVPRGADRLFQALAIIEEVDLSSSESSGGAMTFLYGDVTKPLTQAIEAVPITLANEGVGTGPEGSLSGRFLTAPGVGPSGKVNMYYAPLAGRPEMIVHSTSIFSGFMHFYVPPTVRFSYRVAETNMPLFEKISINSFDAALTIGLAKINVPAAFRNRNGNSAQRDAEQARSKLVGFFGPGVTTEVTCYDSDLSSLNNLYTSADPLDLTGVEWNASSLLVTDARVSGGGLPYAGELCPGGYGDFGVGHMFMRVQALSNGDSPLGLHGPFSEISPNTNQYIAAGFNGSSLQLNWKYLRPTIGDSVDGVGVFTKTLALGENADLRWHDSAPCSRLPTLGFTEVTRVAAGTQAAPVESYTIPSVNPLAYSSGRHVSVLCPYSNTKGYYDFALTHSTGSNNSQNQATRLSITRAGEPSVSSAGSRTSVANNACIPMIVRSTDEFGNLARKNSGSAIITVSHNGAAGTVFSEAPNCGSASATLNINMHHDQHIFFMTIDPAETNFEVLVQDTSPMPLTATNFFATRVTPSTPSVAVASAPALVYKHQCFPFLTTKMATNGVDRIPQGNSGAQAISYATSLSQSGFQVFEDGNCTTAAGSLFYGAESFTATRKLYARYSGLLNSITLDPQVTGLTGETTTINVIPPGPVVRTRLQIGTSVNQGTCVAVRLMAQDNYGRNSALVLPRTTEFAFSSATPPLSGMFSDASCVVPITSVTIASGETHSSVFYFRWNNTESLTISSTAASGLPLYPSFVSVSP